MARIKSQNESRISEKQIAALTTPKVLERGRALFEEGALEELTKRGAQISALCAGSEDEPYAVKARLDADGVDALHCSCPYDHEGFCKHGVALLVAWARTPEAFAGAKATGKSAASSLLRELQSRERDELAQLIAQLVETEPKLRGVVRRLLQPRLSEGEVNKVRNSVESAMKKIARMEYDANFSTIGRDLKFHARAATSLEASRPEDAGRLHAAILEGLMSTGADAFQWDERGVLVAAGERSSSALARLAAHENVAPDQRTEWLATLARGFVFGLKTHGSDFAPDADAVLENTTDDEWPAIEAILDAALVGGANPRRIRVFSSHGGAVEAEDWTSGWVRESIIDLKSRRLKIKGDDAGAQRVLLQNGSPEQRIEAHLQNRDFDAAIALADAHFPRYAGLLERFVERLNEADEWPRARAFAVRHNMQRWLARAATERGESDALALNVALFEASPYIEQWNVVLELVPQDERPELRAKLWDFLKKRNAHALQFDIALHENDVTQALTLWGKLRGGEKHERYAALAQAAEETQPETAFLLWDEWTQLLIAHRSRDAYRQAAQALARAKQVLENAECSDQWNSYIASLRAQYPKLRALLEELNRAQLGIS